MGEVVSIKENSPHKSGKFRCLVCDHEFITAAPIDEDWVECPQCHCERATHKYKINRSEFHWMCACGNDQFKVTPDGTYCPNCGRQIEPE